MLKKQLGISVYPDYDSIVECKRKIDQAVSLGYQLLFTGFSNADQEDVKLREDFIQLFAYAREKGMECHVDINDKVLHALGAVSSDLKPIADLKIPVIRVDCGLSLNEIVEMTNNPYGIRIEENLSNLRTLKQKLKAVKEFGNMNNYCACHNYYPRVNSGLKLQYALECAAVAKAYGCRTGAFITSLYSSPDLNPNGRGIMSVEHHRYIPSHIQAMELFSSELFDFLMFGDSAPREDELKAVAQTTRSAYECLSEQERTCLNEEERREYEELYCIQIPVYLESFLKEKREMLFQLLLRNRIDCCATAIRMMNLRGKETVAAKNTISRPQYCITMDNITSLSYQGELEIILQDLPAVPYANVIGIVKPYAYGLVEIAQKGTVMFQLTEE